jgi:integrase
VKYERDVRRAREWRTIQARLGFAAAVWGPVRRVSSIDHDDLTRLDKALKEASRSLHTINHYFALLKTFFSWAIDKNYHPGPSPIKAIRPYVVDDKRRAYSPEEIEKILEAAARIEKEARPADLIMRNGRRIVTMLLLTGMRLGEFLNMKWSAVQGNQIVFLRTETKQRREKVIPVTPAIHQILDELLKERKDEYVLPLRRRHGVMNAGYADNLIRKIREFTGIRDFVLHGLRHTASTIMVSEALGRGVGIADVMQVLGHSQVKTTMKYQHADLSRMRRAVEVLGRRAGRKAKVDKGKSSGYTGPDEKLGNRAKSGKK